MNNILKFSRELILFIFSATLWLFEIIGLFTITLTVLDIDSYYVQLLRTLMNVEKAMIQTVVKGLFIFMIFIIIYLLIMNRLNGITEKEEE